MKKNKVKQSIKVTIPKETVVKTKQIYSCKMSLETYKYLVNAMNTFLEDGKEFGMYLLGSINTKEQLINITDIYIPSKQQISSGDFKIDTEEELFINNYNDYIGFAHSHCDFGAFFSETDHSAIKTSIPINNTSIVSIVFSVNKKKFVTENIHSLEFEGAYIYNKDGVLYYNEIIKIQITNELKPLYTFHNMDLNIIKEEVYNYMDSLTPIKYVDDTIVQRLEELYFNTQDTLAVDLSLYYNGMIHDYLDIIGNVLDLVNEGLDKDLIRSILEEIVKILK